MNDVIRDRIIELHNNNLGYIKVARILQEEFPNEKITLMGWKSRVERVVHREKLNKLDVIEQNLNDITTVKQVMECDNLTQLIRDEQQNQHNTKVQEELTKHSVERKSDGSYVYDSIIEIFEGEEVTPNRIMEAHKLNPNDWEVLSYKNNYWTQQAREGKTVLLYQSKLIVKPRKFDNVSEELVLQHFMEASKNHKTVIPKSTNKEHSNKLLEVNICDLHLGKLAFDSTSNDVYNYKIARSRFFELIDKEYTRAKKHNVEKILFVWSNDFFNTDGITDATTRGTSQKSALPWQSLFLEGVSMLVDAIEVLASIAPVKSFYISSNHSRQSDFYALCYLQAWFRDAKNVQIINNQKSRYYEKYGTVLLGFSHSYYEKENNLYHLMSTECPDDWATTTYREFHLAHYHSEKVKDVGGVIYRWLPTVCGTDEYHYDKGYVGSVKRSYSFLYDKFTGLIQMNCNIIDN